MKNNEREFMEFAEEILSLSSVKKALGLQERIIADAEKRTKEMLFWSDKANNNGARINMHLAWVDVLYKAFMLGYGANEARPAAFCPSGGSVFFLRGAWVPRAVAPPGGIAQSQLKSRTLVMHLQIMKNNLSVGQWFSFWSAACSVTPLIPTIAAVRLRRSPNFVQNQAGVCSLGNVCAALH